MSSRRVFTSRTQIARTISHSLGASTKLDALVSGILEPGEYMPENEGQYDQFRRYLHDVFCFALQDHGHFDHHEFNIQSIGLQTNNKRINMQKPDLFTVRESDIHIGEVTVTYLPEPARESKLQRYSELVEFIKESGFSVVLDIIVVDLSNPEWQEEFPQISEMFISIIDDMLSNLRIIHSNPRFNALRKTESGLYNTDRFQFKLEDQTLVNQVEMAIGQKVEASSIHKRLIQGGSALLTDDEYIDRIAQSIIETSPNPRPKPNTNSISPAILIDDYNKIKSIKPTTNKIPKILQLGMFSKSFEKEMSFEDVVKRLRTCNSSGGYLDNILQSLSQTSVLEDHIITLNITNEQLEKEQSEGPGRKSYIKRKGLISTREEPLHIGLSDDHEVKLMNLMDKIEGELPKDSIRDIYTQDSSEAGLAGSELLNDMMEEFKSSPVSTMLMFYQSLSNEIVLNSMRRRRTREYALGYSGFCDIFFLVAPGAQLRTESNVEFIKIISLKPPFVHPCSAAWHSVGDHWESSWLSVDTDRLKHWQRSFDRVSLSCMTNAERCVRPGLNLMEALKSEISYNNYCMLALTYLEDKQLTSTTNQTLRYIWMKSLGDKDFTGLLAKFPKRINSYIQSTMMSRSIKTCIDMCKMKLEDLVTVNQIHRDDETGLYDETTTGVVNLMPRLFTFGSNVPIAYNLNEIYWCMGYNKDRQNMVQDSMGILTKILKEELKYDIELSNRKTKVAKLDYFLGTTTLEQDIRHIHSPKPESHYFSYRAVTCGIRLQDNHPENFGDKGSWLNSVKLENFLSKNLSEFATFKASVSQIQQYINKNDYKEVELLGKRTKAIELVAQLVKDENLLTASQVAMQFSGVNNMSFQVFIQIFKKNQIGGTREIIILWIKARIMFNIVEEVARLLSKSDKREILTKGRDKRLMMRGDYEEIMSSFPKGTPLRLIKESFDMSTWCQKFIPTIFMPLFEHHFKGMPGMRDLSRLIFLAHSNKKMEIPRKLVEQWMKHPAMVHEEKSVQNLKDEFFRTGKTHFVNHSNMCQGIPHYNSTVLALSCLSLRDALFKSALRRLKVEQHIKWKTRVGSDDKGTIIGLDMSKNDSYQQYLLLGQCEHAAERLHSMELSVKSASGQVMYELNSAFMANLETLSPTVKFSMAAADMIGTTSCTNFVNESYGRIRQMRENGCSSMLCSYAHTLNARFFYKVFGTGRGQTNDLTQIFNLKQSEIPYDFGIYPTYDIDVQDVIGPEFYNYRLMKRNPTSDALKLLYTSLSKPEMDEMFPTDDDPLFKKDHFGIHQGLVHQLQSMRKRLNIDPKVVNEYFINNPFIMVRGPETIEETKNLIFSKLYTKGASESLRRTSPAIYIGRLAAFRSAKAWTTPYKIVEAIGNNGEKLEGIELYSKSTYSDFLKIGLEKAKLSGLDLKDMIPVLFPQHNSFDVIDQVCGQFGPLRTTDKRYSQAIRTWTVNNYNYEYTSSLKSILETSFGISHHSSTEDVQEFRNLMKMSLTSMSSVVQDCKARGIRPLDMFFYMTKLHKNSKTSKVQSFGHGPSTNSLNMTAISLKTFNHIPGTKMQLKFGVTEDLHILENSMSRKVESLKILYNLMIMSDMSMLNVNFDKLNPSINGLNLIPECLSIIRGIKSIAGFDNITQKTILMLACNLLDKSELRDKLVSWKTLNYTYLKRQKKNMTPSGKIQWSGDLEVLVSSDTECYSVIEQNNNRFIRAKAITDLGSFYRSLTTICRTLDMEFSSFFQRGYAQVGKVYLSDSSKRLHKTEIENNSLNLLKVRFSDGFQYKRLMDLDQFIINKDQNPKTNEIQIYLSDKTGRTATICHTNGNYYPVEIPGELIVDSNTKFLGVSLNRLMTNKSWFFNYRLPVMTPQQSTEFLRNEVHFPTLLSQETRDIKRIQDYIEVREEVNEESFSILQHASHYRAEMLYHENLQGRTLNEMFRETMGSVDLPEQLKSFTGFTGDITDWAEEVENDASQDFNNLMENLNVTENVKTVRAFGYVKPKPRRSMFTITGLQQGTVLKNRVLNCFFSSQDIRNENIKQLPNMYLYLMSSLSNKNHEINKSLMEIISRYIAEWGNVKQSTVTRTIEKQVGQFTIPIAIHSSLFSSSSNNQLDLLDEIIQSPLDYDEQQSDDEDFTNDQGTQYS